VPVSQTSKLQKTLLIANNVLDKSSELKLIKMPMKNNIIITHAMTKVY